MKSAAVWLLTDSSGLGGIETHVTNLATELRQRKVNATIVLLANHGSHPLENTWKELGIPIKILSGGISGVFSGFRSASPQLVHTHGYKAGIIARMLGPLFRFPVVSTYHAGEPGTGRVKIYNFLDSLTGFVSENISVSQPIAKRLKAKSKIIPNFVAMPDVILSNGKSIAFVGRMSPEKGPDQFLELAHSIPDQTFEMFGEGPMRKTLEPFASNNVQFQGAVPSMQNYWKSIGLLCISSRYEGLPLVALEAMSHGIPVAAFAVGDLPKVIDHGKDGFIAPRGNLQALAECIQKWRELDQKQQQCMSQRAIKKIENSYSSRAILPRILMIYERALKDITGKNNPTLRIKNSGTT